jgi:hypothetical protein
MITRVSMVSGATTVGAAILLSVALTSSAQASVGIFRYYDAQGISHSITNPAPGACLRTPGAIRAINNTNGPIQLYSSSNCGGLVHTLSPNEDFAGGFSSATDVS